MSIGVGVSVAVPVTLDSDGAGSAVFSGLGGAVAIESVVLNTDVDVAAEVVLDGVTLDYSIDGTTWHGTSVAVVRVGSTLSAIFSGGSDAAAVTGTVTFIASASGGL